MEDIKEAEEEEVLMPIQFDDQMELQGNFMLNAVHIQPWSIKKKAIVSRIIKSLKSYSTESNLRCLLPSSTEVHRR